MGTVGGNTNIFKGSADKIQTKIGALMTDPKYASLAVQLDAAFQNYRLQMTGAAFGRQSRRGIMPRYFRPRNTLDLNLAKLTGPKITSIPASKATIKNVVGQGGVYIKQYAEGAHSAPTDLAHAADTKGLPRMNCRQRSTSMARMQFVSSSTNNHGHTRG